MKPELEKLKDENGQVSFSALIFFDDEMSLKDKIYWLSEASGTLESDEHRKEAREYLDKLNALQNEFIRP